MPEFMLNRSAFVAGEVSARGYVHPFYGLNDFAQGYVEAMFFTNGDTGDEREFLLNEWGVEKLTKASVTEIAADCAEFERRAHLYLDRAYELGYEVEQAGRDFWYERQGHGVGFSDREAIRDYDEGRLVEHLENIAREMGECCVEAYRGWIYVS